jgi:hypothetical protein
MNMKGAVQSFLAISVLSSAAHAQDVKVLQSEKPKWALAPPTFPVADPPKDALVQIRFSDNQIRLSKTGRETFVAQRFKILRPEALQTANLRFAWLPTKGRLTVHSVRIHRKDGSSAEMLGKATFNIVQREDNLEQSVLTGLTMAVFSTPGVEVGDEVEFSATITDRDPTLGDKTFGVLQLPMVEIGGAFRERLLLTDGVTLNRKITPDLVKPAYAVVNDASELVVKVDNPKSANLPEGAPGRFGVARQIEYSSFSGWPEVSSTFWKHFDVASKLSSKSPVRAEVAKIAAATKDPEERALAALKLVQDRIRYVYVGFGTGNYTPVEADETWERRYADCKGKTALLLAVLRELGVPAEAVLVNQSGVDGIGEKLPSPGQFDHVLVRAFVGEKAYWLDGTRFNSPKLSNLPQPSFRAALPLRPKGAEIEAIAAKPSTYPALLEIVDIDASAGTESPSRISARKVFHGDEVTQIRAALASLAGDDLKQALREIFGYAAKDTENETTDWAYDDTTGALSLTWKGTQKLEWDGDTPTEKRYTLPGAGFTPPTELNRPKEQDQSAPWAVNFPDFRCWVTTMRLPPDKARLKWTYSAAPVDRTVGGVRYFRKAAIQNGVVQTVMSKRAMQAELSTEEATSIGAALPSFDNETSYVYQRQVGKDAGNTDDPRAPIDSTVINWQSAGQLCQNSATIDKSK